MSHQRKLITTALAVTVAIAAAATLGGCAPLYAMTLMPAPDYSSAKQKTAAADAPSELVFNAELSLADYAPPLFGASWDESDWVLVEEKSDLGSYFLESPENGCVLQLMQGERAGFVDGTEDWENSLTNLETIAGFSGLGEGTYSTTIPTQRESLGLEVLTADLNIGGEKSVFIASRAFTELDSYILASVTCFDGDSAETVWNESVSPFLYVQVLRKGEVRS